jgi:hypothetical protein
MSHWTEEEQIEHYYEPSETSPAAREHLESCPQCAHRSAALEQDLAEFRETYTPFRDELYGEQVWQRLAPQLPQYNVAQKRRWGATAWWQVLSYAAVSALLLLGAFHAGRQWEKRQQPPNPVAKTAPAPAVKEHLVVVVLSDHLDRSERLLVELKHADGDSEQMASPIRDEARSLLAANRVLNRDAAETKDPALKTALNHLDRLLAQLADEPGGLNTGTIARLQHEMNAEGLLFEVRVLRSRISDEQSARPRTGGTI